MSRIAEYIIVGVVSIVCYEAARKTVEESKEKARKKIGSLKRSLAWGTVAAGAALFAAACIRYKLRDTSGAGSIISTGTETLVQKIPRV